MKVICTLDLETTGLDFENDTITEFAYVIKEWGNKKPLLISHNYLKTSVEVSEFITELTGIDNRLLEVAGHKCEEVFKKFLTDITDFEVEYVLAQNGACFDLPMLKAKLGGTDFKSEMYNNFRDAFFRDVSWIDSQHDIEWPARFKSKSLTFLACELGFLNPFPHDALSDVMTTNKVVELAEKEGITTLDRMIEYSRIPWVYVECNADFNSKEKAKELRYRWERLDEVYRPKRWINKFKENKLKEATADIEAVGLEMRRIE